MRTTPDRWLAAGGRPLSYGERLQRHWDSLSAASKARILAYLGRRLLRRLRDDAPVAARGFAHAALEMVREVRATVFAMIIMAPAVARKLRDKRWRREMLSIAPDVFALLAPCAAVGLTIAMAFASMSPERAERSRAAMVETARLARAYAPPPCVSDGDGGVWIDVGSTYVRPRDEGYARMRLELCGY